jgi:hypothetical protein
MDKKFQYDCREENPRLHQFYTEKALAHYLLLDRVMGDLAATSSTNILLGPLDALVKASQELQVTNAAYHEAAQQFVSLVEDGLIEPKFGADHLRESQGVVVNASAPVGPKLGAEDLARKLVDRVNEKLGREELGSQMLNTDQVLALALWLRENPDDTTLDRIQEYLSAGS